jgi:superfamily I DNA/RNA helicase
LEAQGLDSWPGIFGKVTAHFAERDHKPFSHIIVDEAQDLGVPELRMLAAIADQNPGSLFFAGDLGQRIFQEPFSWKALGIDIRGRSYTLTVNYRTSHQIRQTVDRLLPSLVRDVDGNEEDRRGTVSVFNGPDPEVKIFNDSNKENGGVTLWVHKVIDEGIEPEEIGIFVRSNNELSRARAVVKQAWRTPLELSDRVEERNGRISIGTMHLAKGLEFKAVVVMACDEDILPLQERIETVADETELDEVYETERHLFYVACTRARDKLLVTGVEPASEYFEDLTVGMKASK